MTLGRIMRAVRRRLREKIGARFYRRQGGWLYALAAVDGVGITIARLGDRADDCSEVVVRWSRIRDAARRFLAGSVIEPRHLDYTTAIEQAIIFALDDFIERWKGRYRLRKVDK